MADTPHPAAQADRRRPDVRTVRAVLNLASGSVGRGAQTQVARLFSQYGVEARIDAVEPSDLVHTLREAVDAAPDLLVVVAGDGTARLAGELCGPEGPLVAPLAGGTMNMLPHALYGARPLGGGAGGHAGARR